MISLDGEELTRQGYYHILQCLNYHTASRDADVCLADGYHHKRNPLPGHHHMDLDNGSDKLYDMSHAHSQPYIHSSIRVADGIYLGMSSRLPLPSRSD